MARTKQTCRKVAGGKLPRKSHASKVMIKQKEVVTQEEDVEVVTQEEEVEVVKQEKVEVIPQIKQKIPLKQKILVKQEVINQV